MKDGLNVEVYGSFDRAANTFAATRIVPDEASLAGENNAPGGNGTVGSSPRCALRSRADPVNP